MALSFVHKVCTLSTDIPSSVHKVLIMEITSLTLTTGGPARIFIRSNISSGLALVLVMVSPITNACTEGGPCIYSIMGFQSSIARCAASAKFLACTESFSARCLMCLSSDASSFNCHTFSSNSLSLARYLGSASIACLILAKVMIGGPRRYRVTSTTWSTCSLGGPLRTPNKLDISSIVSPLPRKKSAKSPGEIAGGPSRKCATFAHCRSSAACCSALSKFSLHSFVFLSRSSCVIFSLLFASSRANLACAASSFARSYFRTASSRVRFASATSPVNTSTLAADCVASCCSFRFMASNSLLRLVDSSACACEDLN
mmetsp:Transcript_4292/g.6806  ORF Transcript_4292/g.6806 Transcript_4292/m.6806 type:complete len:315 (-) Transcript_4292:357-1301(-)